jgi:hypothetical protein
MIGMGLMTVMSTAAGVWALVTSRDAKRVVAPPQQPIRIEGLEDFVKACAEIQGTPAKIQTTFESAFRDMQVLTKFAIDDAMQSRDRVEETSQAFLAGVGQLVAWKPPQVEISMTPVVNAIEAVKKAIPAPAEPQTLDLAQLEKKLERIAEQISKLPPRLGGGGTVPPRRRIDPPAPRAGDPPAPNFATPSIPAPYVGGTIFVPAGVPSNILQLIQQQLQPNVTGSSAEFKLTADDAVFVGAASAIGGPLSDTNYAYELLPGETRLYRTSFPGDNTPIGDLQVFASAAAVLHVEVTT